MKGALAVFVVGSLAACGTTVPVSSRVAGTDSPGTTPVLGAPQAPGSADPELADDSQAPAAGGVTPGSVSVGPRTRLPARGTGGGVTARTATWPGMTATTISIGYLYVDTAAVNAAVGATGAEGSAAGDIKAEHEAVAKWINAHGGIAGRRIRLVAYEADINDSTTQIAQQACAAWTEDDKVYAAVGATGGTNAGPLVACLARHKTLAVGSSYNVGDEDVFRRYRPYYYAPSALEMVSAGAAYADGLGKQGFFSKAAKVGILTYDDPEYRHAMDRGVLPTMRRYGVTSPEVAWIASPRALSDQGSLVAAIQNATLKFRSSGVSHVMFLDGNSSITFFFMKQAQSQEYKPRYGFSTLSYPSFVQANFGADVLSGSVGVGWMPTMDVALPQLPANPARTLCEKIQNAAGNRPVAETDLTVQLSICAELFLIKHAVEHAAGAAPSDFLAGVARLGTTVDTAAGGLVDSWTPAKPWGGSQVRYLRYGGACSCFSYHGPALAAS
ncbi:MAG TPA: ABC transporter substrate-binding protein [Nonomuraea sp.]|nr:ABC transporter substrate-binding protein [Nonomuraea sp.]